MKYVMFKSGGEASTAILGRHVEICETGVGTPAFQAGRDGKLVALVNMGEGAIDAFPGLPELKTLGYPYTATIEYGFALKAGTPEPIRRKLEATLKTVMADPEVRQGFAAMGLTPRFLDGPAFETLIHEGVAAVKKMIAYNQQLKD